MEYSFPSPCACRLCFSLPPCLISCLTFDIPLKLLGSFDENSPQVYLGRTVGGYECHRTHRVWRKNSSEHQPRNTMPTLKTAGGNTMVWAVLQVLVLADHVKLKNLNCLNIISFPNGKKMKIRVQSTPRSFQV